MESQSCPSSRPEPPATDQSTESHSAQHHVATEHLVAHLADAIWVIDTIHRRSVYASAGIERLLGYQPAAFCSLSYDVWIDTDSLQPFEQLLNEQLNSFWRQSEASFAQQHLVLRSLGGQPVACLLQLRVVRNPQNQQPEWMGMLHRQTLDIAPTPDTQNPDLNDNHRQLQRSQTLYQSLVDSLPMSLYRIDQEGRLTFANQTLLRNVGLSAHDLLGRTAYDLYPPQDAQKYRDDDHRVMTTRESLHQIEQNEDPKTGKRNYVEVIKIPIFDPENQVQGIQGLFWDITPRVEAESNLRISQERLAEAQKIARLCYWEYHLDEKRFHWSENTYQTLDIDPDSVQPTDDLLLHVVHPDDRERLLAHRRSKSIGDLRAVSEYRVLNRTGEVRFVQTRTSLDSLCGATIRSIMGTLQDITDLRRMEKELIETQIQFTDFINSSTDSVVYLTLPQPLPTHLPPQRQVEALQQAQFTNANRAALQRYHCQQPYELIGRSIQQVMATEEYKWMLLQFVENNYTINNFDVCHQHPSGRYQYSLENWYGVVENGNLISMWSSSKDITQQKHAELRLQEKIDEYERLNERLRLANQQYLQAKERAEESDRLKSAFLSNMSHEIRTPMNGIIGFADLLNNDQLSEEKRRYYTRIITDSSNRLLQIINDVLDISKIETGQISLHYEEVVVNELLTELFAFFKLKAYANNLMLFTHNDLGNEASTIVTDKTKLYQILTNLLNNALKFTPAGSVRFGYHLRRHPEGSQLEFFVQDTGIGIHPDKHQQVFQRFQQAENDTGRHFGGSGLGLSISKAFIEMLGGRIWLDSEPAKGSTFFFTLPYKRAEGLATEVEPESSPRFTLLVAEDESVNFYYLRELIQVILGQQARILHALNGQEAIELCEANPDIDLVLMDIKMPTLDGYLATKRIKAHNPKLPIVAQTAFALSEDRERALAAGCDDYIAKPIKPDDLRRVFRSYLSSASAE